MDSGGVVEELKGKWKKFKSEGEKLERACTKPQAKEVKHTLWAVGWGCVLLGAFGAIIELFMIPIVRLITGVDVENRALTRNRW